MARTHNWILMIICCGLFLWAGTAAAQTNGIRSPASGDALSGIVTITGSAADSSFLRYELAFLQNANSGAGWIVFAEGSQAVNDGVLAIWDTTVGRSAGAPVFPDGSYQLRLRVVKQDYNYDEFFVSGVTVSNAGPTPTPTGQATRPPAAQPTIGSAESTPFQQPAVPVTLTPFPSPTPRATRATSVGPALDNTVDQADSGLLAQIGAFDFGRLGDAFATGVKIAFGLFALLAVYLLIRGTLRWVWQFVASKR
jgi:hypothetical protein